MRSSTRKTLNLAIIAQRYRLEREMARGGMGTVWLGRDIKLGRQVAVKVMAKELAQMSEALARFEREALTVAQLKSSHVVQVFDYGLHEGLPYIVMELLEGENLGQRLKRMGRIPLAQTIAVLTQICKGLKAAHGAGLIHRDLKPSNIFLARRDDDETVKLLDFGVVKAIDPTGAATSEATSTGILLGTPQYMSPEQARATRDIDNRSDLWSVAVIVFRMLTGHNPFKGESVGDVVLKICSDALPAIREHAAELPESLDDFFEKAFAREPDDRFQSATEMAHAFRLCAAFPRRLGPDTLVMEGSALEDVALGEMVPSSLDGTAVRAPIHSPDDPFSGPSAHAASTTPPPLLAGPYEATPISTTVGGTPIASKLPGAPRPLTNQPVALVIAAAAVMLIAGALGAVWWVGDRPSETGSAARSLEVEHIVIPDVEVPEEEEPAKPAPEVAEVKPKAPPRRGKLREGPDPVAPSASSSPAGGPASGSGKSSASKSRPDWGLGQ